MSKARMLQTSHVSADCELWLEGVDPIAADAWISIKDEEQSTSIWLTSKALRWLAKQLEEIANELDAEGTEE